jgi:hypothetical protein
MHSMNILIVEDQISDLIGPYHLLMSLGQLKHVIDNEVRAHG